MALALPKNDKEHKTASACNSTSISHIRIGHGILRVSYFSIVWVLVYYIDLIVFVVCMGVWKSIKYLFWYRKKGAFFPYWHIVKILYVFSQIES